MLEYQGSRCQGAFQIQSISLETTTTRAPGIASEEVALFDYREADLCSSVLVFAICTRMISIVEPIECQDYANFSIF